MASKRFLLGALTGAAAMYLLDPNNGRQRREEAQQRARELAETPTARKVAGQAIDATRAVHDFGPDGDKPLADRVRSEVLGRQEFSDLVINVDAHEGTVSLRGVVDDEQRRSALVQAVGEVRGVDHVDSYLHAAGDPSPEMATSS